MPSKKIKPASQIVNGKSIEELFMFFIFFRYRHCYRRQSCLVRHATKRASLSILDDFQITSDDVAYSLNKKGRWTIPHLLKEHILLQRYEDSDSPLRVTELHKLKRKANCVGYFSTTGPVRRCVPMKKTYFDATSVNITPEKHNDDEEEFAEKILQPKEVSVNIYYPCPKSSSLTHNSKYLPDTDEYDCHQRKMSPKSKKEYKKMNRKHLTVDDYHDAFYDDFSEEEYEDSDDEMGQYIFSHPLRKDKSSFTAEDVLKQAAKMQELCRNPKTPKQNYEDQTNNKNLVYTL